MFVFLRLLLFISTLWLPISAASRLSAAEVPDFQRTIRPILAAKCFPCHGPDESSRQADFRLDLREHALAAGNLVPGRPDESELIRRIESADPDERMPPADAPHQLTADEKRRIRAWVAGGAKYEAHWAFLPPQRAELPTPELPADSPLQSWMQDPVDRFVLAKILKQGMQPAPRADRYALIRRVSLDLTGLPPTPAEADAFANDPDPQAYEKLVDRLLDSPHYGERWARLWLDLARYSDTNGYEKDRPRSIWPYRDWVLKALNDDMPYDQFSIEQLAGDMLPDATESQRIATGFHRNTMLNEEGGIDPLEFRYYAMVDRVATTGIVWMGMTTGCAQCHSHKYDPLSHTEYFQLMALLDNADEVDLQIQDADVAAERTRIQGEIERLEMELPGQFPPADGEPPTAQNRQMRFEREFSGWLAAAQQKAVDWQILRPVAMQTNLPRLEILEDGSIFSTGDITKRDVYQLTFSPDDVGQPITAIRLEVLPDPRLPAQGPGRCYYEGRQGDFFLSELTARQQDRPLSFASGSHDYGKISIGSGSADAKNVFDGDGSTGWSTSGREGEASQLILNFAEPVSTAEPLLIEMLFERHFAASLGRFRIWVTSSDKPVEVAPVPIPLENSLSAGEEMTPDSREELERHFLRTTPLLADARKPIDALRGQLPEFPTTLVFQERPSDNPRPTARHHRGEYLSAKEAVVPGIPQILNPDGDRGPTNRLEFARWLVSRDNPLAARAAVNRAWSAFFGRGLAESNSDFGTQAPLPTHPELLDWLACEFQEGGWSLKSLHRLIVTSETYRQSSQVAADAFERDPPNQWLARGPRHRVDAETVRDLFLSASGALSTKMYGPGVYPPQPASVTELAYGSTAWKPSTGDDRFRRSVYTFSKRTAPFAAFMTFDGTSGETCLAQRDRSNTPLQALTLLNDEMFLELARQATFNTLNDLASENKPTAIAQRLFRRLATRPATDDEIAAITNYFDRQLKRIAAGELNAAAIAEKDSADSEAAAWILVARALMNLDEVITKQ